MAAVPFVSAIRSHQPWGAPQPRQHALLLDDKQEVAAAGLLEATAADFGLSHQHVTVEAVRTQDWEQSIKVSRELTTFLQ